MTQIAEVLADPVRSRIYFEILIGGEATANNLQRPAQVNRSTLSHHLTKMVEAELLTVRIESIGRSVKYYRLNDKLNEKIVIDRSKELGADAGRAAAFLESAAAHLQLIANLAQEAASRSSKRTKEKKPPEKTCFVFHILSDEDSLVWHEEHQKFMENVEKRLGCEKALNNMDKKRNLAFSGFIPIRAAGQIRGE
ncbi:MAG: ArsR family transcriptional regulator [Candidatus Thorarchaeota archaeon]|nr:ArsR family transcriptional regulator [Candidatus Thorarchaeota archaeon]